MNPSSRTRDMLCIILQDDLLLAAAIVYSRGSDSSRGNYLMIVSLFFARQTKGYPIHSVDLYKNSKYMKCMCWRCKYLPTHMNEQEWYHYSNVPIESVNSWQVSHIMRQHVAVRFQEWNMMKVEEYLSREGYRLFVSASTSMCTSGIVSLVL